MIWYPSMWGAFEGVSGEDIGREDAREFVLSIEVGGYKNAKAEDHDPFSPPFPHHPLDVLAESLLLNVVVGDWLSILPPTEKAGRTSISYCLSSPSFVSISRKRTLLPGIRLAYIYFFASFSRVV